MHGHVTTYRIQEQHREGAAFTELSHDLGRLWAALAREPGHVAGYVVRTDASTAVMVNIFSGAAEADAAYAKVQPLARELIQPERLQVIAGTGGEAYDVRWSNT